MNEKNQKKKNRNRHNRKEHNREKWSELKINKSSTFAMRKRLIVTRGCKHLPTILRRQFLVCERVFV